MAIHSKKVLLGAATVAAAMAAGYSAEAATTGVPVNAVVVQALSITQTATLNFGSLTAGATGGTLVVDNADSGTPTGTVSTIGSGIASGGFQISAATGVNIQIAPTTATVTINTGGLNNMAVDAFTIDGGAASTTLTQTAATVSYALGGRLTVAAGQATGTYTGTVNISANYQ